MPKPGLKTWAGQVVCYRTRGGESRPAMVVRTVNPEEGVLELHVFWSSEDEFRDAERPTTLSAYGPEHTTPGSWCFRRVDHLEGKANGNRLEDTGEAHPEGAPRIPA